MAETEFQRCDICDEAHAQPDSGEVYSAEGDFTLDGAAEGERHHPSAEGFKPRVGAKYRWLGVFDEAPADDSPGHTGDPRFHALLKDIGELHDRKQSDYGRDTDPFANVRASVDFGIEPWVGTLIRANDKMRRLQRAAQGGTLSNEGVEDSLMDLAVYALIALVLYQESTNE